MTEVEMLKAELELAVASHPFRNATPTDHPATGDDLVDRLRGIYRTKINDGAGPLNGLDYFERRFGVGAVSHEAADRIEALMAEVDRLRARVAELEPEAARWEWYAVLAGTPGEAALQRRLRLRADAETMHIRAAIDKAAREAGEATWLS